MPRLAWFKNKPIVGLAPMAGWTDSSFRQICKEQGADLVFSEMIPAAGIIHHQKSENRKKKSAQGLSNLLYFTEQERPIVIQIFGRDPYLMAEACLILNRENRENGGIDKIGRMGRPDEININFGCPAKSAVKSGHGVALMDNPDLAEEIVRCCINKVGAYGNPSTSLGINTPLPITIKMRTGWTDSSEAVPFAQRMEAAGAAAIYIHGRTFKQKYTGEADWEKIYEVAQSVDIPVVGNGDISCSEDGRQRTEDGCLAGVIIGRAARGNPWIFNRSSSNLTNWSDWSHWTNKSQVILKHAKLMIENKGEHGIIEFRKHLLAYFHGFPRAAKLRTKLVLVKSLSDIEKVLNMI